jgi:hypothetical protein
MFIELIQKQIPVFWDTIKYACVNANVLHKDNYLPYFNELLHALLSSKAQCFVRLDENRVIIGVLVTRIKGNKVTGEKELLLESAYSFKPEPQETWQRDFDVVLKLALKRGCTKLTFVTNNPKLASLGLSVGCKEVSRSYEYPIGG